MIVNKSPGKDISHDDIKNKIPLVAKKNKKHFSKINISGVIFGGKKIPIFAGPNTVENKKMIFDIAKNVKKIGASFLRGGAFKPLTFPYRSKKYFETELKGIEWLGLAKEKYKIPVITEVTDTKFLKEICKVADILQIGSRNMQNFPLIIDCAQTGKPIMLKRHYGASLRDWLGAAEYILKEGNFKVILCERGVSTSHTHSPTSRFLIDLQVVPDSYVLLPAFPNPFNPITNISYSLPLDTKVKLKVYNITGELINILHDGIKPAGNYSIEWNAEGYPSGVYFVKLTTDEFTQTQKLMLIK